MHKKLALTFDNGRRDPQYRIETLLNVFDEPPGLLQTLL
jgi:hypothetical protein